MGIRDWLAIIVIVFIVLILLDGFRRKWLERKRSLRVKIDKNIPPDDVGEVDDILIKSELPNGGARIKNRSGHYVDDDQDESDVPVLMESVDIDDEDIEDYPAEDEDQAIDTLTEEEYFADEAEEEEDQAAPDESEDIDEFVPENGFESFTALDEEPEELSAGYHDGLDDSVDEEDDQDDVSSLDAEQSISEPEAEVGEDNPWESAGLEEEAGEKAVEEEEGKESEELEPEISRSVSATDKSSGGPSNRDHQDAGERIEPSFGEETLTFEHDERGEITLENNDLFEGLQHDDDDDINAQEPAEEVVVINVMARNGSTIEGSKLLPVLLKHGLRLGEMSIFHRHADSDGKGPVMFSMANMVKPGTFSISEMETFTTPGVSFFMQIPNKLGNMQCFDQMLKTAEAVKDEMDAQLKDENRSVFTRQTIEHSRQRIRDFELEMLARK